MTFPPDPWKFFDKIYCISIDSRTDRRAEVKKQFKKVGLETRVEYILVQKHARNPEQGIFQSHIHCLQQGLQSGADSILIFEDDVFFRNFNAQNLYRATQFLASTPQWNAFFAGAITGTSRQTASPSVSAIKYRCLAHAYALHRPFAEQITALPWNNIPFDNLLHDHGKDFYALTPMIAYQSKASSDNKTLTINAIRRFFGGLSFIQRVNEWYQHHKTAIILSHLLLFIFVLFIAGKRLYN